MKHTCSTACLSGYPLRAIFARIAQAGFDGVELVMGPQVWVGGLEKVRRLVRHYQLPVVSVHQSLVRVPWSAMLTWRVLDAVRAARDLGADTVVLHGPGTKSWQDPKAQEWCAALDRGRQLVWNTPTHISVENPGWYHDDSHERVLGRLERLMELCCRLDLAVTLDTCHVGTSDQDVFEAYQLVRSRLRNVHLSDLRPYRLPIDAHFFRTLFSHHQMPGSGPLGLDRFAAQLQADGYQGALCSEMNLIALQGWSQRQLKERLAQAATFGR